MKKEIPSNNGTAAAGNHVIAATTAGVLQLNDFNRLLTRSKRIWSSFSSGTPVGGATTGVTDLLMSPEMTEQIRAIAYQPVNTRSGAVATNGATSIPATDSMREAIMNSAGFPTLFGIGIIELLELGINQRYNKIFDAVNTANSSPVTFTQASNNIIFGVDRGRGGLLRPTVTEEGASTDVSVSVDDQFAVRQNKMGWYGGIHEGRIIVEDRVLTGCVV